MSISKKRVKIEEIKRLFEAQERFTTKELSEHTQLTERTLRNYLAILLEENLILSFGKTNRRYYQRNYAIDENPIMVAVVENGRQIGTLSFTYAKGYLFSLYNEKNIEFDKLGVLDAVGLKRETLLSSKKI